MPHHRRDPIVTVLDYFASAPLEAAKLALSLAKEEVYRRTAARREAETVAASPPTLAKTARPRRKLTSSAPTAVRREEDRPLPGLQSTVG